jgi:dipeptidyl aminopeptidase/acylaminoacyl peptidase
MACSSLKHGLLTLPKGAGGARPPLVVMPHGGPFGVRDTWEFDTESQLLAAHGFAVLRVNFRGSGGYGREFQLKGYRQFGGTMQADLADGVRAAIADGHVDGARVCLYGVSYGAYAAIMGPVRDPGLYKCAAGHVGVYDLVSAAGGDGKTRLSATKAWSRDAIGTDPAALEAASPTSLAAQVEVPVFLAAAGRDETLDSKRHSERLRDALTAAGNAPDWLDFPGEGHGYADPAHQREYYQRLLAFLGKHLGPVAAPAAAAATP